DQSSGSPPRRWSRSSVRPRRPGHPSSRSAAGNAPAPRRGDQEGAVKREDLISPILDLAGVATVNQLVAR
ncbi:hypothetical protein VF02_37380, partial [Nostoc linckia z1]|uniref:hypothetical protein n=1 Tax=Nostoc linckia TaxID=92942 RepID=UPI000C027846